MCINCGNDFPDALKFRALEVHTLHIRDFDGERIIQALGEIQTYEICTACALKGVQAVFSAGRFAVKCLPFLLMIFAGAVLTFLLTFRDIMPAFRAVGPIAVIVGMMGIAGKIRDILRERDTVSKMNHDEALRYCAWKLVLDHAPKKYSDNDITYIPVSKDTANMTAENLAYEYNLLPSIAVKAKECLSDG